MSLPTKILVPTDFSAPAEIALDYAIELAQKLNASVHVLHVYEVPAMLVPDAPGIITADTVTAIENASRTALDQLMQRKRANGRRIESHLKYGDPRTMLELTASELGADLICMGTHGRRGLSRVLLGSVAEYTVRTAKIPVLTLRAPAD
jgi:nucleotide-binding universal stress UspA family protein